MKICIQRNCIVSTVHLVSVIKLRLFVLSDTVFPIVSQLPRSIDTLNVTSLACPALPLCPLAITEAERGAPAILERIRASMKKVS